MALSLKNSRSCQSNDKVAPFLNRLVAVGAGHRVIPTMGPGGELLPPTEHERYIAAEQWNAVRHERGRDLVLTFGEDEVRVFKRSRPAPEAIVPIEHEEPAQPQRSGGGGGGGEEASNGGPSSSPAGVNQQKKKKKGAPRERVAVTGLHTVPIARELVATVVDAGGNLRPPQSHSLLGGAITRLDGSRVPMDGSSPPSSPQQQQQQTSPTAAQHNNNINSINTTNVPTSGGPAIASGSGALLSVAGGGRVGSSSGRAPGSDAQTASSPSNNSRRVGVAASAAEGAPPLSSGALLDPNSPPAHIPPRLWQQWVHARCKERDPDGPTALLDRLFAEAADAKAKRLDASRRRRRHHRTTCLYHLKSTSNAARKMGRSMLFPSSALLESGSRVRHAIHGAAIHGNVPREDGGDDAELCFVAPPMCGGPTSGGGGIGGQQPFSPFPSPASAAASPAGGAGTVSPSATPSPAPASSNTDVGDSHGPNSFSNANRKGAGIPELSAIYADEPLPSAAQALPPTNSSFANANATSAMPSADDTANGFFSLTQPANVPITNYSLRSRAATPNLEPFKQMAKGGPRRGGDLRTNATGDDSTAMVEALLSATGGGAASAASRGGVGGKGRGVANAFDGADCSCTDRSTDDEADLGAAIEAERSALREQTAARMADARERRRARRRASAAANPFNAGGGGDGCSSGGEHSDHSHGHLTVEERRREERAEARKLARDAPEPLLSDKAERALQFWQDRFRKTTIEHCSALSRRLATREGHRAFVANERSHLHLVAQQAERGAREIALVRQTRSATPHGSSMWAPVFGAIEGDRRYMSDAQSQFIDFCEFCVARQFPSADDEMAFILDLRNACVVDASSKPSSAAFLDDTLAPTFRNIGSAAVGAGGAGVQRGSVHHSRRSMASTPDPASFNSGVGGARAQQRSSLTFGAPRPNSSLATAGRKESVARTQSDANGLSFYPNSAGAGSLHERRSLLQSAPTSSSGAPLPRHSSVVGGGRLPPMHSSGGVVGGGPNPFSAAAVAAATSGKHSSSTFSNGPSAAAARRISRGMHGMGVGMPSSTSIGGGATATTPATSGYSGGLGAGGGAGGGGGIGLYDNLPIHPSKSVFHARGGGGGGGGADDVNSPSSGANATSASASVSAAAATRFSEAMAMELFQRYGPMFVRSRSAVAVANQLREECGVSARDFLGLFYANEDNWGPFCPDMAVLKKRLNQSAV